MLGRETRSMRGNAVPHRRRTARLLGLLATAALAAGCGIQVSPASVPVPFSVAPTPSASAGVPAYVCTAVYKILTEGAVRLAGLVGGSGDSARDGIRKALTDMAAEVDEEAGRTGDADLQRALRGISGDLSAGARQSDPQAYVDGGFPTVGQKLDGTCE
jgi:hypothetical protein